MDVRIKRVYDPAAASDGIRILIDRIWPRGVTREEAHLDEWARELAPSTELRRWFGHDPARFEEFRHRYLLSYTPRGVARDGWHRLEVRVKNRRATIKARPGYLAGGG